MVIKAHATAQKRFLNNGLISNEGGLLKQPAGVI